MDGLDVARAAREPRDGGENPVEVVEWFFHTPEAAAGKGGLGRIALGRDGPGGSRWPTAAPFFIMKNLMDFSVGAIMYWAIGWALIYGDSMGAFIGGSDFFVM